MKKLLISILLVPVLMVGGCMLAPKPVEFFQDKVQKFPEPTNKEREVQKQAARLASDKAQQTLIAAVEEGSSIHVTVPAAETVALTESVADSLGPPRNPWEGSAKDLSLKLDKTVAELDKRLLEFKFDNNENAGKKIEGTGLFSVGYFTLWGVAILGLLLVVVAFKIWGMINPIVGLGVNTAGRVGSTIINKGFSELVAGGNKFSNWVESHSSPTLTKEEILELFTSAHKEEQSRDVREVVRNLTRTK